MKLTRSDYLLARLAHGASGLVRLFGNVETEHVRARLDAIDVERPLFLTGLARSGTTILLEELAASGLFATHQYRDFPFVMAPLAWNWLIDRCAAEQAPVARPHQDRIQITRDSPEAFEEPLWQHFFPHLHAKGAIHELGAATRNEKFERFFREHLQKILLLRGKAHYLSKGNYNVTRIEYLARLFPHARFVVPVRAPVSHVQSLVRQHELFCNYAAQDPRVPRYLAAAGHYEFGPQRVGIRLNRSDADAAESAWRDGREHFGYALQWGHVYGHVDALRRKTELADRIMIVRYEDFCRRPKTTLETILRFAGFNPPEDWDEHSFDHIAAPSKDRAGAEARVVDEVFMAIDGVAEKFGYDAAGALFSAELAHAVE